MFSTVFIFYVCYLSVWHRLHQRLNLII